MPTPPRRTPLRDAGRLLYRSWFVFLLLWVWILAFAQTDASARLLGKVFPVVSPLHIDSVEETMDRGIPSTRISGTSLKIRNCSPVDMRWFIRDRGLEAPVPSYFQDPPRVRRAGIQTWHGLIVGVPPSRLSEVRAEVTHLCGAVTVTSEFYTPRRSPPP